MANPEHVEIDQRGEYVGPVDLSWVDLSGADLRPADLRGANLRGADLSRANLSGSNAEGANFSGANLEATDVRCWLDEHQMLPGDDIYEQVDRGIRLWDKVLLVASENSLKNSWWVDGEINRAFTKEQMLQKERGKKVLALIPLKLDDYLFRWESGKATEVKSRLAANFVGWESDNSVFEREFENVVKALRTDEGGRESPPESKL